MTSIADADVSPSGSEPPPSAPPKKQLRGPRGPYKKRRKVALDSGYTLHQTNNIHIHPGADPELVKRVIEALQPRP